MAKVPKEIVEEIMENLVKLIEEQTNAPIEALSRRTQIPAEELRGHIEVLKQKGYLQSTEELVPTEKGQLLGRRMVRKHRLLERFLHDVLGLQKESVHDEACKLEHGLSDDAEAALCRYLQHPQNCPDDNKPIPACSVDVNNCADCETGQCSEDHVKLVPLTSLEQGRTARIKFIRGGRKAVQRLRDMGLVPEVVVTLNKKAHFGGPLELVVCSTQLALGQGIAEKIFVEVC
jgi:DtxR family Mn-dependent transcriptional regulator